MVLSENNDTPDYHLYIGRNKVLDHLSIWILLWLGFG